MKANPGASGKKPDNAANRKPVPGRKKPPRQRQEKRDVPFNNPFADLLKKR
jgi:hypothetical protein